jgi:hypothetical protein
MLSHRDRTIFGAEMSHPDSAHARRTALRASYLCAVVAAGLLALHFNAALLPSWTQGIALLSGGLALAGVGLAAYSFGSDGWTDIRYWPAHLAFGLNALLGLGFLASVTPAHAAEITLAVL